ncbi:MAG: hypothetical protein AUG49_26410 [Catenulispora sp. 13_1_20CM_3_70_7]|nr:MAG: hypothetical protein AUG49_26410 [Catenulispora sp. 13_1_20CM_3_70_7]
MVAQVVCHLRAQLALAQARGAGFSPDDGGGLFGLGAAIGVPARFGGEWRGLIVVLCGVGQGVAGRRLTDLASGGRFGVLGPSGRGCGHRRLRLVTRRGVRGRLGGAVVRGVGPGVFPGWLRFGFPVLGLLGRRFGGGRQTAVIAGLWRQVGGVVVGVVVGGRGRYRPGCGEPPVGDAAGAFVAAVLAHGETRLVQRG